MPDQSGVPFVDAAPRASDIYVLQFAGWLAARSYPERGGFLSVVCMLDQ